MEENLFPQFSGAILGLLFGFGSGLFFCWQTDSFQFQRSFQPSLLLAGFATAGTLTGCLLAWILRRRIDPASVRLFSKSILPDETVVLAEVQPGETARVLEILNAAGEEKPVTWAFRVTPGLEPARPPARELASGRRIARNAIALAHAFGVSRETKARGTSFLVRLGEIEKTLERANASLTMSADMHHAFTLSAEWLLDNAYLIREQIADLRGSLPPKQYGALPLIANGPQTGLPRVDRLAAEIVAESGGELELETIRNFIAAFQTAAPLDIGELWALPLMLRVQLLESLRELAGQVAEQQNFSEEADFWASRLMTAARHGSRHLLKMMDRLMERHPEPSPHFASELVAHLYDEEAVLPTVTGWLERFFRAPLLETMRQEHRRQAAQQTTLANLINSCRRLSHTSWPEFFESISWADQKLAADPAGVYNRSDFETRDRYRTALEQLARGAKRTEREVIKAALALAEAGKDEVTRHVGYYFVDAGRPLLERKIGARVPVAEHLRRWLRAYPARAYFGSIFVLTIVVVAVPLYLIQGTIASLTFGLLGILLIIPASELAVLAVNYFATTFLPPRVLPKMSFRKEGVPDECRTLVVVPTLLTTLPAIQNELTRLEIRYLGNSDPNLCFALLTDFADAPLEHMPEDAEYLDVVRRGIEELNRRHGAGRFFLFHRGRCWCESEQRWIGWERKRGKLEQLNRFLLGEKAPELEGFLVVGDRAALEGIRYVITLDADTQLMRDAARRLIETLAHPLNQARLSEDGRCLRRGYTIIQPSVSASLPSASATWFSRIFADQRGIDPYTRVVSDVYQDLVGEGSYIGKGIYDLRTFHRLLSGRFPENQLLSHDLLEGSYVRVGLASDIELLDVFPSSFIAWWSRQHRWIRGDWQIIDWLKSRVPLHGGGEEPNPLTPFNRWKIFDNLRRSLVPPTLVPLLLAGWTFTHHPFLWSAIIAGLMLWPVLTALLGLLIHPPPPGTRWWREPRDRFLRSIFLILLLPDHAGMSVHAIGRVVYRRLISHRRLLEWEAAQDAHLRARNRERQFIFHRLWIPFGSVALWVVMAMESRGVATAAAPFLFFGCFFQSLSLSSTDRPKAGAGGFSPRATGNSCAARRDAPGDTSMTLSARRRIGCRRITCKRRRGGKFSCARHRQTSVSGCWPPLRRTTLATSRRTI